mgnify:CR=1 FL=1|jgi:hypothetical protein
MAKKKIKKLLKGLGIGAALLGAGKALMNRRDKANQMKEFLATEGGDLSDMRDYGPFSKRPNFNPNYFNPAMMLQGIGDDPVIEGIQAGAKKGGRIVKTKKGGRAVRKANRSKKK